MTDPEFFHLSPSANRRSIERRGLLQSKGHVSSFESQQQVYFAPREMVASLTDFYDGLYGQGNVDVWMVRPKGLRVEPDPIVSGASFVRENIPKQNVSLYRENV